MGIELEVVENGINWGFVFISSLLYLVITIGITNQKKRLENDYPDSWKEYLITSYFLGFVLSLGFYFLLVYLN